jgi:hypothetical protein
MLSEWDYDNNINCGPSDFTYASSKRVNWKCKLGHKWTARIADRTRGRGCPVCAGKVVEVGFNDLTTIARDVCSDWDYDENGGFMPEMFTSKSGRLANWKCHLCGYKWSAKICNRVNHHGCPECAKNIRANTLRINAIKNKGSLKSSGFDYVKEWDYEKNNNITPDDVLAYTNEQYWWKCGACGCEWLASPDSRSQGSGCPECARSRNKSKLQEKVEKYIIDKYNYFIAHEYGCSVIDRNPVTNYPLPYDNDVTIGNNHLIIEVMGEQHYKITNYVIADARKREVSPKEELLYIQWKDEHKKQYAISQGYYYLAVPYTSENDESYKQLIDNKIHEILTNNTK